MPENFGFRRTVLGGAASTLLAQVFRIGATFASTIVVARLLSPADYGLYATAAPVAGFALMFQNVGFDHAVVQSAEVSDDQLSSLFWLNLALCAAIALALVAVSPLVSLFYGNSASGLLVAASSLLILTTAPNPMFSAILNRRMRFHAQSIVDIVSSLVMVVATIAAALALRSYWALLIGALASTVTTTIMFVALLRWRPLLVFNWQSISPMVRFGSGVSSYGFTQYLTRNLDNVLLARFWGVVPLGYYDRAYKLMLSPLQNFTSPLGRNLLPVLARTRDDPPRFRRAYLLFVQSIAAAAIPAVMAVTVGAAEVIDIFLGSRWHETTPIFRWLAATAALLLVNETGIWLLISTGRTRQMIRWSMFAGTSVVVGFFVGLPWSAQGMAIAYLVGEAIRTPVLFAIATRETSITARDMMLMHLMTLVTGCACLAASHALDPALPAILRLACLVAVAYSSMPFTLLLSPIGRQLLALGRFEVMAILRSGTRRPDIA